jgi:hypothetical protein
MIGMLTGRLVSGRCGLCACPPLWCQFPSHDGPRTDQKGDTDNRRRGERGEILQHGRFLSRLVMCPQ